MLAGEIGLLPPVCWDGPVSFIRHRFLCTTGVYCAIINKSALLTMTLYFPQDAAALAQRVDSLPQGLVVACYCAAWCDTCRDYQSGFRAVSEKLPQHTFVWVDIEDHPQWLGDHDVEDFPTIVLQDATGTVFFGEQLPYPEHLERLIQAFEQRRTPVVDGPPMIRGLAGGA